jgi:hypothetical protein
VAKAPIILLGAAMVATALPTFSQQSGRWTTERAALNSAGDAKPVAVVHSTTGDSLRVFKDAKGVVHLSLRLRRGLERLAQDACPTFQVDRDPPSAISAQDVRCTTDTGGARVAIGQVDGGSIDSSMLQRLMNGTAIVARFRLKTLGYRKASFTLSGSKQALFNMIGPGVTIEGV